MIYHHHDIHETSYMNTIAPDISDYRNIENNSDSVSSSHYDNLLWKWVTHTCSSYHDLNPKLAQDIRTSILVWYRKHRRKLPWRGDCEPFDGSASENSNKVKNKANYKRQLKSIANSQSNIKSFLRKSDVVKKGILNNDCATTISHKNNNCVVIRINIKTKTIINVTSFPPLQEKSLIPIPVTPYGIWVSEIMLQQTRVEAVIPYYLKWMQRFPTVHELANASVEEVNSHWAGLGFYRRARLLHKGAKYVVDKLDGIIPHSVKNLMNIDGIGKYSACAISSIAYNESVPVVDGNVCRVLSRLTGIANHIKSPILKDKIGWRLAEQIVKANDGEEKNYGEVNQALMELGATYCSPSGTGIDPRDPLKEYYLSTRIGKAIGNLFFLNSKINDVLAMNKFVSYAMYARKNNTSGCLLCKENSMMDVLFNIYENLFQEYKQQRYQISKFKNYASPLNFRDIAAISGHKSFPIPPPKTMKRLEIIVIAVLSYQYKSNSLSGCKEKLLMVKRPDHGLLAGQWEFPSLKVWESSVGSREKKHGQQNSQALKKNNELKYSSNTNLPIITVDQRYSVIKDIIMELFKDTNIPDNILDTAIQESIRKNANSVPIEHVFSHVRHTMWIQHIDLSLLKDHKNSIDKTCTINSFQSQKTKWMTYLDMQLVGVTSGVKKVLSFINKL